MAFDSLIFVVFFLLSFAIYWSIKTDFYRRIFLSLSSLVFYGFWDWRYIFLMLFVTIVAYFVALKMAASKVDKTRRRWLIIGICSHLSVLFFFKYVDFFINSVNSLFLLANNDPPFTLLKFLLPVGISFYTFHAISYTIDVYKNKVNAETDFFRVALYISFFPQLIAGPIVRATFFLPQLQSARVQNAQWLYQGLRLFLLGFLFKTVFADNLATLVDPVFENPQEWRPSGLWVGSLAYYGQIYFDFSGYSYMAIGCALWFGYRLPENFAWPYSSLSITEFWRRWHISLSSWLRDYVYISLGGNRNGTLDQYRNIMITMVLGGLWHGASWTFVMWGAMHGIALILHKLWMNFRSNDAGQSIIGSATSLFLTQFWVFLAWIFFRANNFSDAALIVKGLFGFSAGSESYPLWMIIPILAIILTDILLGRFDLTIRKFSVSPYILAVFLGFIVSLMLWMKPLSSAPFIYFQF